MQRYDHGGDIYSGSQIHLDFSVNTNPLGMPEEVEAALIRQASQFSRYPDPHCRGLRSALTELHGLSPEHILCGNGAADLIFRICACYKPKHALVLAPTFSEYERPVKLFGGQIQEFLLTPENGFALTEAFLDTITPETDMVFLCNPNNPTGRLAPFPLLRKIAQRCQENGTVLVVDECFLPFTDGTSLLSMLPEYPNLLILKAFTKLYSMAGLRLGYLLGAPSRLDEIRPFGAQWSVSGPAQAAGFAALSAEPEWSARTKQLVVAERLFMAEQLSMLGITVFPSDANFLLLKTEIPLYSKLLENGILVRDCSNFTGLDGRYIRIGLKTRSEHQKLLHRIREICYG